MPVFLSKLPQTPGLVRRSPSNGSLLRKTVQRNAAYWTEKVEFHMPIHFSRFAPVTLQSGIASLAIASSP